MPKLISFQTCKVRFPEIETADDGVASAVGSPTPQQSKSCCASTKVTFGTGSYVLTVANPKPANTPSGIVDVTYLLALMYTVVSQAGTCVGHRGGVQLSYLTRVVAARGIPARLLRNMRKPRIRQPIPSFKLGGKFNPPSKSTKTLVNSCPVDTSFTSLSIALKSFPHVQCAVQQDSFRTNATGKL